MKLKPCAIFAEINSFDSLSCLLWIVRCIRGQCFPWIALIETFPGIIRSRMLS